MKCAGQARWIPRNQRDGEDFHPQFVLDFPPNFPYNKQTSRSARQATVELCSPEETVEKQVSWGHEDPQQAEGSAWCTATVCGWGCGPRETALVTGTFLAHPILQACTESFLTATNEGACPCQCWLKNTSTQIYLFHCWCVEPEHHHKVFPWPKRSLN